VPWRGQTVMTAIWKAPVAGPVPVRGVNVDGDEQGNPEVHGGVDMALYVYAGEDADWWAEQLRREVGPGSFGENLTTRGVDVTGAVIGERWRVGSVELEVCQPRQPCFKLGLRFGDPMMLRRFAQASRPGAYLRIVREGELGAGDAVKIVSRPAHGITVGLVGDAILLDDDLAACAAQAPELPASLAEWLRDRAAEVA
jgi:MOSC domain-containing protein YiiM